jgi:hypothetical protein
LALALASFGIGTTEFVIMGLARELVAGLSTCMVGIKGDIRTPHHCAQGARRLK